jgi:hypothetical protein
MLARGAFFTFFFFFFFFVFVFLGGGGSSVCLATTDGAFDRSTPPQGSLPFALNPLELRGDPGHSDATASSSAGSDGK